jgi:hypothetical protein
MSRTPFVAVTSGVSFTMNGKGLPGIERSCYDGHWFSEMGSDGKSDQNPSSVRKNEAVQEYVGNWAAQLSPLTSKC